jgi:hypothetical protein
MYSTLVAPPTPVATSRLVISTQMRWPRLNWLAVAMISMDIRLSRRVRPACVPRA